ncbi:hypothetical protein N657DRAFT_640898 [Parathielavia appendiculata]|uniref:Uncharacterized protein n=1 Tax=Parathielavia appendiculata TaxID=2587402 RepID=A0AAN6U5U3_9PEZI|nr:hypothetical protein N657DRAFT_640898 [Parathielavia appendiculata]
MRSSFHVLTFFLLGLVAGLSIPKRQERAQYTVVNFSGHGACHPVLTSCRVDGDCCSGLQCGRFDDEVLCVPAG